MSPLSLWDSIAVRSHSFRRILAQMNQKAAPYVSLSFSTPLC